MANKKKIIIFVTSFTVIAKLISLAIGVALMEVLGKTLLEKQIESHLSASNAMAGFQMQWPWYYGAILTIVFSAFWFWVGRMAYQKLGQPNWRYSLLVPPLYFLISFDLLFPVYVLVTATGALGLYGKRRVAVVS